MISNISGKPLTRVFLVVLVASITIYDSWVMAKYGYSATISATITNMSPRWLSIPFIFGFINGHLFAGRQAEGVADAKPSGASDA